MSPGWCASWVPRDLRLGIGLESGAGRVPAECQSARRVSVHSPEARVSWIACQPGAKSGLKVEQEFETSNPSKTSLDQFGSLFGMQVTN